MKIIIGILLGVTLYHLSRKAWLSFQLHELEIMAGRHLPKDIQRYPGKLAKRFKYLHNFIVETRLHLRLQLLNFKKDLLKLGLKYNVFNFKSTPLGKCLQARIDAETAVFGVNKTLIFYHEPFFVELKNYFYSLTHPDPVVYGGKSVGKGEGATRGVNSNHRVH